MWKGWPAPTMVAPEDALPGRAEPVVVSGRHVVLGTSMLAPFPEGAETVVVGMGCFWGAERVFWELPGVLTTAVGFAGGYTPHPTYDEVCTGRTGHAEVVLVVFDPATVGCEDVLRRFWEAHDPTQPFRQGNDVGTQYRSLVLASNPAQLEVARAGRAAYDIALRAAHFDPVVTELGLGTDFFYAEERHQQLLAKDPAGYCGLEGTGVSCPSGPDAAGGWNSMS